jgi:ankyrin repeat protein
MKLIFFPLLFLQTLPAENAAGPMYVKAAKEGDIKTIETLFSIGFNANQPIRGYTPLWFAIQSNRPDIVELLLEQHADPDALVMTEPDLTQYGGNITPLKLAVLLDNQRIAQMLISSGAKVDAKGPSGRTALYEAVRDGHLDFIRFLIETGAAVNIRDKEGASPLDYAIWSGSVDSVALLLAHAARPNEVESQTGATPINEAAFLGHADVVRYLIQFHPDLATPDKRGYRPLDNAIRSGKEESAVLLLDAEPNTQPTKYMDAAIRKGESAVVTALLHHGAIANGPLPSGLSPLDVAASAGSAKVVRVLLENGADPNLSGKTGTTPLEDASLKGFPAVVSLLLDHGAKVNQLNPSSGTTALYAAASFGKSEVVKLLLDRGANPSVCGSNHKSPYEAARDNGYPEVAALFPNRDRKEALPRTYCIE